MSDLKEDYAIRSSIHQIIKNNTSKKYFRLTLSNENKIIKSVKENHKQKYLEILNKRDYYVHKLNTLLNESIEDENSNLESFLANQFNNNENKEAPTSKRSDSNDINPKYITKQIHAKDYVMKNVIPSDTISKRIKSMIQKHFKFQEEFEAKRKELIKKANEDIDNTKQGSSVGKLAKINSGIIQNKKSKLKEKLDQDLLRMDQEILMKSAYLTTESRTLLKELHIPFFDIHESFLYPELEIDQEFMLDYLRDHLA